MIKNIWLTVLTLLVLALFAASWGKESYDPIKFYNRSGQMKFGPRIFMDTVTVSGTGNAFSIDITAAGFTGVKSAVAIPMRNTATLAQQPMTSLKTLSTSAAVFNVIQPDFTGETILGIPVFGGDGFEFVPVNTVVLQVFVFGN